MVSKEIIIECECSNELLKVSFEDGMFDLAIYKYRHTKLSLRQRLRYMWNILRTGEPYSDQMVLTKYSAIELSRFLEIKVINSND